MFRAFLTALCLGWTANAVASEIYRCEGEDGSTIFSQQPCADDADVYRLEGGSGRIEADAIESAQSDAEIQAACRQAVDHTMALINDRARELAAQGQSEAAAMLEEAAASQDASMRSDDIEQCRSDWSDPRYREGWQCLAAATTAQARQSCLTAEFNQILSLPM